MLRTDTPQEGVMGLTGKFKFRKTLWGKIVLQIEDEVKPFWSKSGALKRRWRDATLMDRAAPEMRPLIYMCSRPHLRSQSSFGPETTSAQHGRDKAHAAIEAGAPVPNEEVRRIAH
jgi:hypothetical protein